MDGFAEYQRQIQRRQESRHARALATLAPQSNEERRVVDWLCMWEDETVDAILTMAKRQRR